MPRQFTAYEPDAIDCDQITSSIAQEFGCVAELTTTYALDKVQTICRCWKFDGDAGRVVQVQSMASRSLKTNQSLFVQHYSVLLDCWHQLDRGVLAAASRPVERGWNGRPRTPRRRHE